MTTKTKSNSKRALIASGISLVLCFAMLLGTTFAWFSDSVSNKGNKVTAGDLKIGFYYTPFEDDVNTELPIIGTDSSLQNNPWINLRKYSYPILSLGGPRANAQPGDKVTSYVAIRNEGSIPLKYYLDFVVDNGGLGDAVTLALTEIKPSAGVPVTFVGSELENQKINGSSATQGEYKIYKMDLKFLESAGNTYQGGTFTVDLNLTATQDKEGARNALLRVKDATGFASATANSTVVLQKSITLTNDVKLDSCNIDLNGYTLNLGGKELRIENTTAMVTAGIEDGKIVDGKLVFNLPNGSASLSSELTNVDCDVTVSSNTFVFNGKTDKPIVMNQGTIQVKSVESQDIIIKVPATASNVSIEDKREKIKNKLTVDVESGAKDVSVVNNPVTGAEVTVTGTGQGDVVVAPPSTGGSATENWIISAVEPSLSGNIYSITNAKELAWLAKAVNNGQSFLNKTIKLTKDIDLSGKIWTPIGTNENEFQGKFDGAGHSVSNMLITGMKEVNNPLGFFGKVRGATIIDFKIDGNIIINGNMEIGHASSTPEIGGLCGLFDGGTIERCASSVNIDAMNATVLAGTGTDVQIIIGGLVGTVNSGASRKTTITDCLNAGNISAKHIGNATIVGGIFGLAIKGEVNIKNVLNVGEVPVMNADFDNWTGLFTGGIAGAGDATEFESNNWYSTKGEYIESSATMTENPLYNSSSLTQETFKGFDFTSIWKMGSNGYPVLR